MVVTYSYSKLRRACEISLCRSSATTAEKMYKKSAIRVCFWLNQVICDVIAGAWGKKF